MRKRRLNQNSNSRRLQCRKLSVEKLDARRLLAAELTAIGTFETGIFDGSGAEIVAYDPSTQRAFFTNAEDDEVVILDITDPTSPTQVGAIDVSELSVGGTTVTTGGVNSVAVENGLVAVAIENDDPLRDGYVGFFDTDGAFQGSVIVGTLPDMLTFTPDGSKVLVANEGEPSDAGRAPAMVTGEGGFQVQPVFTVGEQINGYTPPGILDGLAAMQHPTDSTKVRVFANHELLNFRGYPYDVSDGDGGTFSLSGARISYFDIDKDTRSVVDAGLAYDLIYDANGDVATDNSFLANDFIGFSRFCSGILVEAEQFGADHGLVDTIYFAGEEDGGFFNPVGGGEWALDVANNELWHVPAMGRGAWENITEIDTGTTTHVAFILSDDSSPFDFDPENENGDEAAPLYLYVGEKDTSASADFLERNGLRGGKLYVWVSDNLESSPADFNGLGGTPTTLGGTWVEVNNTPDLSLASETGEFGFDEFGYPTQGNLWLQSRDLGAFGFSRPEDVATNPSDGTEIVLASTGVDTYDGGVDTFGTIYTVKTDFSDLSHPTAVISILYDGDADPDRGLRSPDNLDWADDGLIYVQEDKAEDDTLDGEPLFGPGAVNSNEAGIIQLDPSSGHVTRVATIDRRVVLDPTTDGTPFDVDAGDAGEWESSGIVDVSSLFGEAPGSLFLFDVQAHGIEDQSTTSSGNFGSNADSRISDFDLREGGQLAFLQRNELSTQDPLGSVSIIDVSSGAASATVETIHFTEFDGLEPELIARGVRLFPGKSFSQDAEPEYIAVSPDGTTAMVTLQEANAFAILDIATSSFTDILPLGAKDHSLPGHGLDPSDRDGGINIGNWPVFGLYMPDAIASYEVGGMTYYITANEGDDRGDADEDPWGDAVRLKDIGDPLSFNRGSGLSLDASFDPSLLDDDKLGRLTISSLDGDIDGDGELEEIYAYGARSFSIWDANGSLIFDSGDDFEQITAAAYPDNFNASNDENDAEGRSDNKGPEPEAVTTGVINGRTLAFVGLERIGGIMVYDVTDPTKPVFQQYVNNRDFSEDPENGNPGDLGVEDIKFIPAADSPNGAPLVITSNEVSGTVSVFQISGTFFNDGVLEVIGTGADDDIKVKKKKGEIELTIKSAGFEDTKERYSGVNLLVVHGLDGNDNLKVQRRVDVDAILFGGNGKDKLSGGGGLNFLDGGAGNDKLKGGNLGDILVGGEGKDKLDGKKGSDLLIGGLLLEDVHQVFAEWQAGSLSPLALLVEDDEEKDELKGGKDADVFFSGLGDKLKDFKVKDGDQIV